MSGAAKGEVLAVGYIASVFGVNGWVKIHSHTSPGENIFHYPNWLLKSVDEAGSADGLKPVVIDAWRKQGKGFVARLIGYTDRDQAKSLCGLEIVIPISDLPVLDDGEYYWRQLEGLKVIYRSSSTSSERNNEGVTTELLLGVVSYLFETGSNDVFVVKPIEGSIDNRERLIPYLIGDNQAVQMVDLDAGVIWVNWDPDF